MPRGPARRDAVSALESAGFDVSKAREPYEGTARFVETPTDLVVLSLERFRKRDVAFVETVRRRGPGTRLLLLVPDGRRPEAVLALEHGADAYVIQPFYRGELEVVARRLVAPTQAAAPETEPQAGREALAHLATEVAHAVGNPLQVLSLLAEEHVDPSVLQPINAEIRRVRDVMSILNRYGHLGAPQRDPGLLGPLLTRRLDALAQQGIVALDGSPPDDGPTLSFDADQLGGAFDDLASVLAAQGAGQPVKLRARVRPQEDGSRLVATVRASGIHIDDTVLARLLSTVVWSHDETRAALPGLALPAAVAQAHGGRLLTGDSRKGTVLALELPLEAA